MVVLALYYVARLVAVRFVICCCFVCLCLILNLRLIGWSFPCFRLRFVLWFVCLVDGCALVVCSVVICCFGFVYFGASICDIVVGLWLLWYWCLLMGLLLAVGFDCFLLNMLLL